MPKHEYGREGAYLQDKVFTRGMLWVGLPLAACLFLIGFALTYKIPCVCVVPILFLVPTMPAAAKAWERSANKAIVPYAKGLRGELEVGAALRQGIGPDSYLIHDLSIGERGNIDHVAVTPGGIFSIETKALAGSVFIRADRLWVNRMEREDILKQAFAESRVVRDYLDRVSKGWKHDVMPLLVFTRAKIGPPVRCRGVWVLGINDLSGMVTAHTGIVDPLQRSRIAAALGTRVAGERQAK